MLSPRHAAHWQILVRFRGQVRLPATKAPHGDLRLEKWERLLLLVDGSQDVRHEENSDKSNWARGLGM